MSTVLAEINKKLAGMIRKNFSHILELSAVVVSVNNDDGFFTIKSMDQTVDCYTSEKLDSVKINTVVCVKGWLAMHPANNGGFILRLHSFCELGQNELYSQDMRSYHRLVTKLRNTKNQQILSRIGPVSAPTDIRTVALIVVDQLSTHESLTSLENFKKLYENKCSGKLYIYHLTDDISVPIKYFSKKIDGNNIDLICFLTSKLSPEIMFRLSSKSNVRSLLHRKNCPYLVSVICDKITAPLTTELSNCRFFDVESCIKFVQTIQTLYRKNIRSNIIAMHAMLKKILQNSKLKFLSVRSALQLSDAKFVLSNNSSGLFDLKRILLDKLISQKLKLFDVQSAVMKNIIDDQRYQDFVALLIDNEKTNNFTTAQNTFAAAQNTFGTAQNTFVTAQNTFGTAQNTFVTAENPVNTISDTVSDTVSAKEHNKDIFSDEMIFVKKIENKKAEIIEPLDYGYNN